MQDDIKPGLPVGQTVTYCPHNHAEPSVWTVAEVIYHRGRDGLPDMWHYRLVSDSASVWVAVRG